jgi:hypothetical protein
MGAQLNINSEDACRLASRLSRSAAHHWLYGETGLPR